MPEMGLILAIDVDILKSILTKNLKDIEEFYTVILKKFHQSAEPEKKV